MHHLSLIAALPLTALIALPAQGPFKASRFLPGDYHNVVHLDLAKARETGVWDELDVGLVKLMFTQLEEALGLDFDSLVRMTMVPQANTHAGKSGPRDHQIVIYEGNRALAVPNRVADDKGYVEDTIGGHAILRKARFRDELFVQLRPEVQIHGSTMLLQPMLEGTTTPGMPCPDVLSLIANSAAGTFAYFVIHLADKKLNDDVLGILFPGTEWPVDDEPQYMFVSLAATGDPDDPHVEMATVLRHPKVGDGLAVTEKAMDARIQQALDMPELRMLVPLLQRGVRTRDRSDLIHRWDLGRARNVAGQLGTLATPIGVWFFSAQRANVAEAELVVAQKAAAAAAAREKALEELKKPKPGPKPGKGKNDR